MSYALRFCAFWVFSLLVLPLVFVAGTVSIVVLLAQQFETASPEDDTLLAVGIGVVVLGSVASVAVMWYVGTLCYGVLVRSRAIRPLPICLDDRKVRSFSTVAALQEFIRQRAKTRERGDVESGERNAMLSTNAFVTPVSGGWSFFLAKKPAKGPCVVLDGLRGPCGYRRANDAVGSVRFYSGTNLGEVLHVLAQKGLTLASTPSHDTITLGGWIGGCAHGTGGNLWTPTTGRVTVIDQMTGEIHDISYEDRKRHFGMSRSIMLPQYIITEVEVLPVDNVWTQLTVRRMRSEDESYWWLTERSRLRCIFTGKRGSLMMLWIDAKAPKPWKLCGKNEHVDPHCCSRECRYFQADILSAIQRPLAASAKWFEFPTEPAEHWDGKTPLSNANKFSPTISALGMAIATFYTNFEVFVRVRESDLSPNMLTNMLNMLQKYHTEYGGRTETRFGVYKGAGKLFVDFGVPNNTKTVSAALALLGRVFGKTTNVAFHPGKYVPPLELASPHVRVVAVSVL